MLPVLQIGPLSLQTQGLILLIGLWLGWMWIEKNKHATLNPSLLSNILFLFILVSIISARLIFVIQNLSTFIDSPLAAFALSATMLDPLGGAVFGSIAVLIYIQRKKMDLLSVLDGLTPFFLVMQVCVGFSNLASGEAYGMPTRMPWGIELWGAFRHPSQVYEIIASTIILLLVWFNRTGSEVSGMVFFRFLALSSAGHLFLEAYRGDSSMLTPYLRLPQLVAWLLLALSLWQIGKLIKKQNRGMDDSQG